MGVVVGDFDRLCTINYEWTDVSGFISEWRGGTYSSGRGALGSRCRLEQGLADGLAICESGQYDAVGCLDGGIW